MSVMLPPEPPTPVPPATPAPPNPPAGRARLSTILFLVLLVVVVFLGPLSTRTTFSLASLWAVVALAMLAFVLAVGFDLQGNPLGILISERNLMSLSRFQLAAWTILICSAFVTVGVARVFAKVDDPLGIAIPAELWQLLGISAASTVGASLILQNKGAKEPADRLGAAEKVAAQTQETPIAVDANRHGIAYANGSPKDARITDMFQGDDLGNTAYIDVSKLQMFFFTLVAVVAYAVNLYKYMVDNTPEVFTTFPALSPGLVAILGISHAAYLGSKSVDKTKTT